MKAVQTSICSVLRSAGQSLDVLGRKLEVAPHVDKLQPSVRNMGLKGIRPNVTSSFVAPSATVAGNVTLADHSAIWYGAIIRGQTNSVSIGAYSSIGDLSVITSRQGNTKIGANVSIGSGVSITDSVVEDNSVVSDGAKIMKGAKVESHALVAAGAVVSAGTVVPAGQVWGGCPATYLRDLPASELQTLLSSHQETLELAVLHAGENAKSWEQIEQDENANDDRADRNSEYYQQLTPEQLSKSLGEVEGHMVPGRIFDSEVSARTAAKL